LPIILILNLKKIKQQHQKSKTITTKEKPNHPPYPLIWIEKLTGHPPPCGRFGINGLYRFYL